MLILASLFVQAESALAQTQPCVVASFEIIGELSGPAGGSYTALMTFTRDQGCAWSVSGSDDWIRFPSTSGKNVSLSEKIPFSIAANSSSLPRTGTIFWKATGGSGQVSFVQNSSNCFFVFEPSGLSLPASGGSGSFTLFSKPAGCAISDTYAAPSWLTFGAKSSVTPVDFSYTASANTGPARSGEFGVWADPPRGYVYLSVQQSASASPVGPPSLDAITPNRSGPGVKTQVRLQGKNFIAGATVMISNTGISVGDVIIVSTNEITAVFSIPAGTASGPAKVTVQTSAGTSNAIDLIVDPPPFSVSCTPAAGPSQVGVPYTATCTGSGGTPAYSWVISSGSLPAGLALTTPQTGATISGTPKLAGDYSYTVRATDRSTPPQSEERTYSGTIRQLSMTCKPETGPAVLGMTYTARCSVSGGTTPYSWSIEPGFLPAGLMLTASGTEATITGTPAAAGDYSYTVRVSDASAIRQAATHAYTGIISQMSMTCLPEMGPAVLGMAYTAACSVSGGTPPYRWSIEPGSLPEGLTFTASGSEATITGTPAAAEDYSYTVRVIDSGAISQAATRTYTGRITPLSIACSPETGPAVLGMMYTATCSVSGGTAPYSWSIDPGSLPGGLNFAASGTASAITGIPAAAEVYSYTVRVTDSSTPPQAAIQAFAGTITQLALACSPATGPAVLGMTYTATCSVSGGAPPYTFSIEPGSLPAGLTFTASASGATATIAGTPAAAGDYSYTVRVIDSSTTTQTATRAYTGSVSRLAMTCTPETGPDVLGMTYTATCSVSGGTAPFSWSIASGSLPAGLTLAAAGGTANITGVPAEAGDYSFSVRITDSSTNPQAAEQAYTGTIRQLSVTCTPEAGPAQLGMIYTATCSVAGGTPPYTWSAGPGFLPAGLTLITSTNGATIRGTPTAGGEYNYTIQATDSSAPPQSATRVYTGTILGSVSAQCDSAAGPTAVGTSYTATCSVTGGRAPYTWTINSGSLPEGLTLNSSGTTAVISGTPTVPGAYSYAVTVADSNTPSGAATKTYAGSIRDSVNQPEVPVIAIAAQPAAVPTQPIEVELQLSAPSPVPLQGSLSLSFRPLPAGLPAGYSDPALQFASGGKTLDFVIPAGVTSVALQNRAIQQGTVAGEITISLTSLRSGTTDVTPQPSPTNTVNIPILPPVITPDSVRINNVTPNGLDIEFTAYSTPRDLTEAQYTFAVASGTRIVGSATVSVDVRSAANEWYASSASHAFGSLFRLRMRFTVDGDANSIASVAVTVRNSAGNSAAVTGRR